MPATNCKDASQELLSVLTWKFNSFKTFQVVGTGRCICLDDKKDLPYLRAVIEEVLRYSTIGEYTFICLSLL